MHTENTAQPQTQSQIQSPSFITTWADKIKHMGLAAPAILLLEIHKPLSFTASQVLLIGQPFLNTFLSDQVTHNAVDLFANRSYLNQFIKELEK